MNSTFCDPKLFHVVPSSSKNANKMLIKATYESLHVLVHAGTVAVYHDTYYTTYMSITTNKITKHIPFPWSQEQHKCFLI